MDIETQRKAELYQIMLVCVATVLKYCQPTKEINEVIDDADTIILLARAKAVERYIK